MNAKIHRGAHEVGGSCVEVEHDGARLVLDVGWPLAVGHEVDLPVPGTEAGAIGYCGVAAIARATAWRPARCRTGRGRSL